MAFPIGAVAWIMLISAFAASFLPTELSFTLCVVFLVFGTVFWFTVKKSKAVSYFVFAAALGFLLPAISLSTVYYPEKALCGEKAHIVGTVTEISVASGNPQYTVRTESVSIEGAPQTVNLRLGGWGEHDISPYDKISCDVAFLSTEENRVSEVLANRAYKTNLYAYMGSAPEVIGSETNTFGYYIHCLRNAIASVIYDNFSDWRIPFTKELLLGIRGELPNETVSMFRYAGMSHILAISGLHLSIIIGIVEKLLRNTKIGKNSAKRRIILAFATLLYMFIAGLGKSILRAGIMLMIAELSGCFHTDVASKDRLGAAVISILLIDPLSACDIGFLLSIVSSAGIIHFSVPINIWFSKKVLRKNGKFVKTLGKFFSVTVSAWFSTLPLSLIFFGGVSITAPLANMISSVLVSGAISFAIVSVIFGFIPFLGVFSEGSAYISEMFENLIYSLAKIFANLPFSYVNSENLWVTVWILGSVAVILVPIILSKKYKYVKLSILVSVATLLVGLCCNAAVYGGTVSTEITALKDGTAISCSYKGNTVLIAKGVSSEDIYKFKTDADVLISLVPKGAFEELSLMKKTKPELAIVSKPETGERYSEVKMFSPGRLSFWNDGSARFLNDGIFEIDINGTLILYISEKCDIMNIEPRFRKADIAIFDGVSPLDFPKLRCKTAILREQGSSGGIAEETEVLEYGSLRYCSRGKNIKKGWISA